MIARGNDAGENVPDERWLNEKFNERFIYMLTKRSVGLSSEFVASALVPHRYAVAITGAVPSLFALMRTLRVLMKKRRLARNQCIVCGYDLRASGETCPECGTLIRKKRKAKRKTGQV
jgi:rRNA maturation endonuclease Nob1